MPLPGFKAFFLDGTSLVLVFVSQFVGIKTVCSQKLRTVFGGIIGQSNTCLTSEIVDVNSVLFGFKRRVLYNDCMFKDSEIIRKGTYIVVYVMCRQNNAGISWRLGDVGLLPEREPERDTGSTH